MALIYTTRADVEAYIVGWTTDDPAELDKVIAKAERDVDGILGAWPASAATSGLKLDPISQLSTAQQDALNRAVCAQAEYRLEMGEAFFARGQHRSVAGPDYQTTGELPYIGPRVWVELAGRNLVRNTGRVRPARSMLPPWHDFVVNDTSWDYDPPSLPTMKTP